MLFSCSDSFTEDSLRPNGIQDFLRKIMSKQDNRLSIMRGITSIGDNVYQLIGIMVHTMLTYHQGY